MSINHLVSILGIPIAKIGIDRPYNVNENMLYTNGFGSEDLKTFSVCIRFNVEFLRPELSSIFSYSTFISDNTISSWLKLDNDTLTLNFCTYWGVSGITTVWSRKILRSINIHNHWHHTCWLYNTDEIDSKEVKVSTKLFFDGKEVNQGDALLINSHLINETHKYTLHCRYTFCRQR